MKSFPCLIALSLIVASVATSMSAKDLRVQFVKAERQVIHSRFEFTGTLKAVETLDLGFRQGGRVSEVMAEEGDRVMQGAALARLDPVQFRQSLNVAKASLAASQASRSQATQASDRAVALLDRGIGTRAARDEAAQMLSQAKGAVERAESDVDQATRALADTVLRAPQDVVVTARNLAPGQIVGAAQPVLSLATVKGLEADFEVPDSPVLHSALGQSVELTTVDLDGRKMRGTVTRIAPLVDASTGTVSVQISIDGMADDTSILGAAVRAVVDIPLKQAVAVPWTALMRQGAEPAVWVVDPATGQVSLTDVVIAHFDDTMVFLSEGLSPGQTVVATGAQMLYPGRRVIDAKIRE